MCWSAGVPVSILVRRKLLCSCVFRGAWKAVIASTNVLGGHWGCQRLAEWLAEYQVSHVVMEATGQYWKPVWDVLAERGFELMLVNAL